VALSVAALTVVRVATSAAGSGGPVYFHPFAVTPRPAMPAIVTFDAIPEPLAFALGDTAPPDMFIPGTELDEFEELDDDEAVAAFAAVVDVVGTVATSAATGYVALSKSAAPMPAAKPHVATGLRRTSAPIGARSDACTGTFLGSMATARRTTSGAMLGSVPVPLNIDPRPMPVTQNASWSTLPPRRKALGRLERSGPRPMATDTMASTHALWGPMEPKWPAMECRKLEYHPGPIADIELMPPDTAPGARLAGSSHSTAELTQNATQTASAPKEPSGPTAAADDATPTAPGASAAGVRRGQTRMPMAA